MSNKIDLEDLEDMDPEDLMPCGTCPVCSEYLDHRDFVLCDRCKQAVHSQCCDEQWVCRDCIEAKAKEDASNQIAPLVTKDKDKKDPGIDPSLSRAYGHIHLTGRSPIGGRGRNWR